MAGPAPVIEEEPMKWYQPVVGLLVVLIALASFGIAIAGASDNEGTGHDDDSSHVEDGHDEGDGAGHDEDGDDDGDGHGDDDH